MDTTPHFKMDIHIFTDNNIHCQSIDKQGTVLTTSRFMLISYIGFYGYIYITQGWYIVTYALGIYHLNLFIAFLSPKIDPAMSDYEGILFSVFLLMNNQQLVIDNEDGPSLPTKVTEEFRPFIRRLPEFKFWYSVSRSTVIALFCTFFEVFNVPVFWPILVMYFITLFCLTMKRQIKVFLLGKF